MVFSCIRRLGWLRPATTYESRDQVEWKEVAKSVSRAALLTFIGGCTYANKTAMSYEVASLAGIDFGDDSSKTALLFFSAVCGGTIGLATDLYVSLREPDLKGRTVKEMGALLVPLTWSWIPDYFKTFSWLDVELKYCPQGLKEKTHKLIFPGIIFDHLSIMGITMILTRKMTRD